MRVCLRKTIITGHSISDSVAIFKQSCIICQMLAQLYLHIIIIWLKVHGLCFNKNDSIFAYHNNMVENSWTLFQQK